MRGTKRKRREGVWELRVYVGKDPETGNPRQISRTFHGGSRAADDAVRLLRQRGYRARRLDTGYPEWERAGLPVDHATRRQAETA